MLLNCCKGSEDNCRYLITSNKVFPLADLALLVLSRALSSRQQELALVAGSKDMQARSCSTALCGPLLHLLASVVSVLALGGEEDALMLLQITDSIRYFRIPV